MEPTTQGPVSGITGQPASQPAVNEPASTEPAASSGQAGAQAPAGTTGEPDPSKSAASSTGTAPEEPVFFDPKELPPELIPAYKQMQGTFTKKMQAISGHKEKVAAYDAFMANPVAELQRMAAQYGYKLDRPGTGNQDGNGRQAANNENWEPKTWDDVMAKAEERAVAKAYDRIMGEISPLIGNVQEMRAKTIEHQLAEIDPNWQQYEDEMRDTLKEHPSLVKDVAKLYRLSVPEEVLTSRSVQAALRKLQDKTQAGHVGTSTRTKSQPAPKKVTSFQEAVQAAKAELAEQGG